MCYSILVQQDLKLLERTFGASVVRSQFDIFHEMASADQKKHKPLETHPRIYPGYFASVIVMRNGRKWILPMRYRIRPHGSLEEVPAKYNLFNARLDSLKTRKTWLPLFMKQHGVIVVQKFFEWVEEVETQKKRVVAFFPNERTDFVTPVLWDYWNFLESGDGGERALEKNRNGFFSFAVITSDPPLSVSRNGHDRCPIVLRPDAIDRWLQPENASEQELLGILSEPVPDIFSVMAATP